RRHTSFSRDWSSDVCSSDLVALVVFQLTWPKASAALIPDELLHTLSATETVAVHLANGDASGKASRDAQRELQHRCFALWEAYEIGRASCRARVEGWGGP